ncbi:MAG: hypothetical protein WC931_02195 [Bacilli bacterium]|jgi:hypothetical protein
MTVFCLFIIMESAMDKMVVAAISAGVSAAISIAVAYFSRRSQRHSDIHNRIIKCIELAMSYPHVEDNSLISSWSDGSMSDEKKTQYTLYCCFIFNLIEDVWRFCWFERNISRVLYATEYIRDHRIWWSSQSENVLGYSKGFRRYVQSVLDDIKVKESGL